MADSDATRSGVRVDNHEVDNHEVDKRDAAQPMPAQASADTQNSVTQSSAEPREFGAGPDVEDEAARADAERAATDDAQHRDTPADAMVTDPADRAAVYGGDTRPAQDTGASPGTAEMPAKSADEPASPRDASARTDDTRTAADTQTTSSTPFAGSSASTMDNGVAAGATSGQNKDLAPGDVSMQSVPELWPADAISALRDRWRDVQLRFVDDPNAAAAEADSLVGEAIETLQTQLAMQRTDLAAWRNRNDGGDDTERLRVAVQRYREFLDRVLGV